MKTAKDYIQIRNQYYENNTTSIEEVSTLISTDVDNGEQFFKIFGYIELNSLTTQKIEVLKNSNHKSYMDLLVWLREFGWSLAKNYSLNFKLVPLRQS